MNLPVQFPASSRLRASTALILSGLILWAPARAADLTVSITNLTHGTWFTPLLVAAHPSSFRAFSEGSPASTELQWIAEAGDTNPMQATLPGGSVKVVDPAGGPLKPGASATSVSFKGGAGTGNSQLTVLAMLVPSNDGFVAANAINIPTAPGTYTYYLKAYDAGTEANDEKKAAGGGINMPGLIFPPFLNDSSGKPVGVNTAAPGLTDAVKEGYVHVHRGIIGASGNGPSALSNTGYRWLNPVAKLVLTVQ
jgi:hypothetical protein